MGRKVSGQQQTKNKWPSVCQVQTGRTVSTQAFTQAAHLSPPSSHRQRYRGVRSKSPSTGAGPGAETEQHSRHREQQRQEEPTV